MEPASLDTHTRAPRSGSLENPLVVEDVPGHVIPILEREFDDFETESTRFLEGRLEEAEFIKFRLKQGVYGQRQPDVQMIRVKLPMGGVTPDQLDAFASVIEQYAPLRKGHVTTRQNIQIHHVPLTDMPELMRELADTGLSSREGCGNTMRNVTGDPRAGTLADEPFDMTPYAAPTCGTSSATRRPRRCRARSRRRSPPTTPTTRSPGSTTWRSCHGSGTASAASRSGSAAERRSCRGSRRRCTSSSSSTTATT